MTDTSNPYASPPAGQPGWGSQTAAAHPAPGGSLYPAATQVAYASWGQRVGANLLDGVFQLPFALPYLVGFALLGRGGAGPALGGLFIMVGLAMMLGASIWNRYVNGGRGQSWGKKMMGLWLVRENTGQPIGGGMAFVRDIAHVLDNWSLWIGYLWPLWDPKRQTFADKVCGTVVTTTAPVSAAMPAPGVQQFGAPSPAPQFGPSPQFGPPPQPYAQPPLGQQPFGQQSVGQQFGEPGRR